VQKALTTINNCVEKAYEAAIWALDKTELSPRELAVRFTEQQRYFISESTACRILKKHDLLTSPAKPYHPMTQGKIERWHRMMKDKILLENYYLPGDLEQKIEEFVTHYNSWMTSKFSLNNNIRCQPLYFYAPCPQYSDDVQGHNNLDSVALPPDIARQIENDSEKIIQNSLAEIGDWEEEYL